MNEPRSEPTSPAPATLPPGRYDDARDTGSRIPGKLVAALLALLVLALVVAAVFTSYRVTSTPSISGEQVSMTVVSDQQVDMILNVSRDEPGTPVYCIVRAQDQTQGELGRREVYVPPAEGTQVRLETTIATTSRAFITDVYGCGDDVPGYLQP